MKRYLRDAGLFLVGILILNFVVRQVVAPLTRNDAYLEQARALPEDSRGVLLADSHGTRLDSALLAAAGIANLSTGSDSYADMRNKLRYALGRAPVKFVLISVDGHMLSKYREYTNNLDMSSLLVGQGGVKATIRRAVPLVDPKSRDLFKASLSARLGRGLKRLFEKPSVEAPAPAARVEADPGTVEAERKARARRRAEMQFKFAESSEELRTTLLDIAAICREAKVPIIGIRFPLSGEYLREIEGKDYGAAATFREAGLPVLDYEALYRDRSDRFEDPDHLNREAGSEFTRFLLEELRVRGLL